MYGLTTESCLASYYSTDTIKDSFMAHRYEDIVLFATKSTKDCETMKLRWIVKSFLVYDFVFVDILVECFNNLGPLQVLNYIKDKRQCNKKGKSVLLLRIIWLEINSQFALSLSFQIFYGLHMFGLKCILDHRWIWTGCDRSSALPGDSSCYMVLNRIRS